jgi:dTDP-glucose 4,6-dehydratase
MKILITGGAGFQGSHLTEHFVGQGHDVSILSTYSERSVRNLAQVKDKVTVIWGSITDPEVVKKSIRDRDVVFHLAARVNVDESIEEPWEVIDVNMRGTYNVLEGVRKAGCRMIHASTCEVYGSPYEGEVSIPETHEMRPYSPYAASKAGGDRLCFAYYKTFGVPVTVVRPFNIYGERQKDEKGGAVIAIFTRLALEGKTLKIHGNGRQTRDYMHVSDLVNAYDLVLKNQDKLLGKSINFGSGKETSVKDIAEAISKETGAKIEYTEGRPGEVERFVADNTLAESFGFKAKVDMWEGLKRYVDWRKQQAL